MKAGIPIPVLREIARPLKKAASKRVDDYLPLTRLLWDEFGREGRNIALIALGGMELKAAGTVVPLLFETCPSCVTWALCDAVRKMAAKLMPAFVSLLPNYVAWERDPALVPKDQRSVHSAIKALDGAR